MKRKLKEYAARALHVGVFVLLLSFSALLDAEAFTLKVKDDAGDPVKNYRWLVEEDTTNVVPPGTFSARTLGVNIHTTYAPVQKKGHSASSHATIDVPSNKRWLVTILPDGSAVGSPRYTASGHLVEKGADNVTVVVNKIVDAGVLTAQISVFIFNDNAPVNNAPDIGEPGLGDFSILLFDQLGQVSQDAFGNQLGTTYQRNPDGTFQFNADGTPVIKSPGNGEIQTCVQADVDAYKAWQAILPLDYSTMPKECNAVGEVLIKFIPPGKYGTRAVPPPGQTWTQTSTIEGTPGIDSWVKANEPNRLVEFGPALYHVFIGFVQNFDSFQTLRDLCASAPPVCVIAGDPPVETCTPVNCTESTVTGNIRRVHSTKAQFGITPGPVVEECFIGINGLEFGTNTGIYVAPCNADSTFTIPNVPPGTYQLVAWDRPLDHIFYFTTFIVDGSGTLVDLTDTNFMNQWFGNIDNTVFYDANQNGFRDCVTPLCNDALAGDEIGIEAQNINLRWRDGSIYQFQPTDINGESSMTEVFPLFRNYILEVDFARFKATGATIIVDDGGDIPPFNPLDPWAMPSYGKLNPQAQFCTLSDIANGTIADYGADKTAGTADDVLCTTVGQSIIHPFTGNNLARLEQGVVLLEATTVYADQTNKIDWGKVNYQTGEHGGITGVAVYNTTRAENDPMLAATDPWEPGIPRVQFNLYADWNNDGLIDDADANGKIQLADVDNYPFGNFPGPEDIDRNSNGIFDRGDALNVSTSDSWDDNMPTGCQGPTQYVFGQPIVECAEALQTWNTMRPGVFDGGYAFDVYYPFGPGLFRNPDAAITLPVDRMYIVETVPPPGFEITKEEDKNVDFGDSYVPSPLILPAPCVGTVANKQPKHVVPAFLDLFPDAQLPAYRAGETTPLCNMKQILLADKTNAAADFHLFTTVPKSARGIGLITNDVAITQDPNNPNIGEKLGVVWMPISVQDLNGHELTRVYTDQFGVYNFLTPSNYSVNIPVPTGVSPSMERICLNHPGPIPNPNNPSQFITDPFFDRRYSLTCYTLDFWPGKTTYLDTPVIPVAAYTAVYDASLDCQFPDGTPVISDVTGPHNVGPYVAAAGKTLTIKSPGNVKVENPDCQSRFDPQCNPLITRDYGFGTDKGTVRINGVEVPKANVTWGNKTITAVVPAGATTGQLEVVRGDNGQSTVTGITVTIGGPAPTVVNPGGSIQVAIDAAATGDLIIVRPGRYNENIIMDKNVKLQGSGAFSTFINSAPTLPENLQAFKQKIQDLLTAGAVSLVPGEILDQHIEYAAITVLANDGVFTADPHGRIDGFTLISATSGGGVTVNGYAHYLEISNNRVTNNAGSYGGGIRVGTPGLTDPACDPAGELYCSSGNDNISIHNNHILENGSVGATTGGGGIAIFNGADNYRVTDNYVCGNFTTNKGGGIAHIGLSPNGLIAGNKILLNESSFNSLTGGEGGGIYIQGEPARVPVPPVPGVLYFTPGTGSVKVNGNLIQANMAGNGKGGGIFVTFANGLDVNASPADNTTWYAIDIFNNIVANNVAGWMGGGVFLQDAAKVRVDHNTIVNNSSTSSGANALLGVGLNQPTIPQGAGLVSGIHSLSLANVSGQTYANPELLNNIIRNNGSYSYDPTINNGAGGLVPHPSTYWDLQVFGATDPGQVLDPGSCILASLTGPDGVDYTVGGTDLTNIVVDPSFMNDYVYLLRTAAAPGEGGNTVQVSIKPIGPQGDYHLRPDSPAINLAAATVIPELATDYDGEVRPDAASGLGDIGADEFYAPANITLVTPNGGEVIATGSTQTIFWEAPAGFPVGVTYRLQVSYDNGSSWKPIPGAEALTTTSFIWTVPARNQNMRNSLIRVQAFNGTTKIGQDVSDNVFEVEVVKVIYPSDATVEVGSGLTLSPPFGINWRLNDMKATVKKARIELSIDGGATWQKVLVHKFPAENTLHQETWTVPTVHKGKTTATVRVLLFDGSGNLIGKDQSNTFFTILPAQ
ncbi:MAG: hypothetical protein FIA94_01580 [Nitrospirae bacterium]|nr:hypothetical protein [Nitrospirota bacterium]